MLQLFRLCFLTAACVLLFAGPASAVPLGSGTLIQDIKPMPPSNNPAQDNIVCLLGTYDDLTYDVFGTTVNLSTDAGSFVCTASTSGGVRSPVQCESYPDNTILSSTTTSSSVCLDENCVDSSFVTEQGSSFAGTLPDTIDTNAGAQVTYTADGMTHYVGPVGGASAVPGCSITAGYLHFTGTFGINAFKTQATTTGMDQTVTFPETTYFNPLTGEDESVDVAVSFSEVTGGGTTTVTATSNSSVGLPDNFAIATNGFQTAFLDIHTTAVVTPPIVICSSYADADDDGILDGTVPAVSELALTFLHGEDGTFVDRTSSRDTEANTICATVDSLSPFAVMVNTDTVCSAPNDPCDDGSACTTGDACDSELACNGVDACDDGTSCTTDACASPTIGCTHTAAIAPACNNSAGKSSFAITDSTDDGKDKLQFQWGKGTSPSADFGFPLAATSYTLCAFDDDGQLLSSATAPAASTCGDNPCWTTSDKGVKYADKTKPPLNDGLSQLAGTPSEDGKAKLKLKGGGDSLRPFDLSTIVYPVTVQVRTSNAACWEQQFVSEDEKTNDGAQLKLSHKVP
jgi:hypothetical protein